MCGKFKEDFLGKEAQRARNIKRNPFNGAICSRTQTCWKLFSACKRNRKSSKTAVIITFTEKHMMLYACSVFKTVLSGEFTKCFFKFSQ